MMRHLRNARFGRTLVLMGLLLVVCATPALAGEPDPIRTAKRAEMEHLGNVLLVFAIVVCLCVAIGAAVAVLRTIVPAVATRVDTSVARLGTLRLLLTGILPLVGTGLLGWAVEKAGSKAFEQVYVLAIGIPLLLAMIVGAMGALPHLGRSLLKGGAESGPLKAALVGGLVLGLLGPTWILPPLGLFLTFVVMGWLVGVGIGSVMPGPQPATAPSTDG